jgi:spermidine synthase
MIDSTRAVTIGPRAQPGLAAAGTGGGRLPVPAGIGRGMVLIAVFICAACGLVYELTLIAIADHLVGDTVTQTSVVLSLMVFAMGVGSLTAKRLRLRASVSFGLIEALLALIGGASGLVLFAAYVWFGEIRPVLFAFALAIGVLIGMEMPLLMTLIQRIRKQDPGGAVADLSAADYVGALLGGLAFPFLLLPILGQLNAALLTGVINVLAGGSVVLWLFRRDLSRRARGGLLAAFTMVVVVLLTGAALGGPLNETATRIAEHGSGPESGAGSGERGAG